jgi:hypothetical protein
MKLKYDFKFSINVTLNGLNARGKTPFFPTANQDLGDMDKNSASVTRKGKFLQPGNFCQPGNGISSMVDVLFIKLSL